MKDLINLSLALGMAKADIIDTNKIIFNEIFRKYCMDNVCQNYDSNYSCPPYCGSFEKMRNDILRFNKALILESDWEITDYKDIERIKHAKKMHNYWSLGLKKRLLDNNVDCLMCGASDCSVCSVCARKTNEECRYPELKFSCLSAYCVNVMELCKCCNFDYNLGEGKISFFSIICFN